ncbi:MAG TPA: hypothetical protein VFO83_14010, partial [Aggregicoccus sp.]|nr:hypothetical protein [Aggregicoccus sp.]
EGTLEFLDALPVTRARLFAVKLAVALPVVLVYPVGADVLQFLLHAASRTSLDPGMHLGVLGAEVLLFAAEALVVLSLGLLLRAALVVCTLALGLLLSHLRSLSWLVLGVLTLGVLLLEERLPFLGSLDPVALARPDFVGSRWRVPWAALRLQLPLALAMLLAALGLYAGWGEGRLAAIGRRLDGRFTRWLVRVGTVGVAFACIALVMERASDGDDAPAAAEGSRATYPEATTAQALTEHYLFRYPTPLAAQAAPVLEAADGVFETVRTFLGAPAQEEPVVADLSGSARHTAGTAYWETLRMGLEDEPGQLRATLAHETSHVLARRLAGASAGERLYELRLFNEGLSTYVEQRFYPVEGEAERLHFVAGAMQARGQVRLEELLSPALLTRTRDSNLVYPLGALLVEALVQRYGDDAPGRVLRALGRPGAPEELSTPERWQDTFDAAGMDLSRVVDGLYARLDALAKEHAETIAALHRPRGVLVRQDDALWVRPRLDGPLPEGWRIVCRFRTREDSPLSEYDGPHALHGEGEAAGFRRNLRQVAQGRLWFQLGLRGPGGHILYEPWASLLVEG